MLDNDWFHALSSKLILTLKQGGFHYHIILNTFYAIFQKVFSEKKFFLYFNTYNVKVLCNPILGERHLLFNLVYSSATFCSMHKLTYTVLILVFQNSKVTYYMFCNFIHVLYLGYIPY